MPRVYYHRPGSLRPPETRDIPASELELYQRSGWTTQSTANNSYISTLSARLLGEPLNLGNGANNATSIDDYFRPISGLFRRSSFSKSPKTSVIGLEFENEFKTSFDLPQIPGWRMHGENSLRDFGFEYVLSPPQKLELAKKMTEELFELIDAAKGKRKMSNSIRTSTHVHFDVTRYTWLDLMNFASTYWILEGLLGHFCGDSRQGNLFCLRLKDAMHTQQSIISAIHNKNPWSFDVSTESYRYASLNFAAVPKFGSLEFRLMRGVSSAKPALQWIDTLESIKQFALKFKNPGELNTFFIDECDASEFPKAVLGENWEFIKDTLPKSIDITETVRDNYLEVANLLTAVKDWGFESQLKEEEKERKATAERLAKEHAEWEAMEERRLQEQQTRQAQPVFGSAGESDNLDQLGRAGSPIPLIYDSMSIDL